MPISPLHQPVDALEPRDAPSASGSTLATRLLQLADDSPDAPAVEHVAGGTVRRRSRRELMTRTVELAERLGPGRGGVLPIVLRHDPDLVPLFLAGILAGRRPCILAWPTPRLDRGRWTHSMGRLLDGVDAGELVTCGDLADDLRAVTPAGCRVLELEDLGPDSAPAALGRDVAADAMTRGRRLASGGDASPDELAFLQFSSGTTGLPKGLGLSHRAVLAQVAAYAAAIDLTPEDRVISWLPLYHDMGLVAATLLPLLSGASVTMLDPIEWVARPAMLLEHASRTGATVTWQPNFAFDFLARAVPRTPPPPPLDGIRAWISCSEPVRAASLDAFLERFSAAGVRPESLLSCYAMAENTFAVTQSPVGRPARRFRLDRERLASDGVAVVVGAEPGGVHELEDEHEDDRDRVSTLVSSGPPIDGVILEIRDDADRVLPEGRVGRIVVASPSQFPGYWPRTDRTGAYDTGDLGVMVRGELIVTGRVKDLIIVRGRNVHPHELEAAASEVPGVRPGRVVALGCREAGASTESVLLLVEPAMPGGAADEASLAAAVRSHVLATVDLPDVTVEVVPPRWLSKTSSGKIARGANLERWEQARAAVVEDAEERADPGTGSCGASLADHVAAWLAARGVTTEFDAARPLRAMLDSLSLVELLAWLEERTGIALDDATRAAVPDAGATELAEIVARAGHPDDQAVTRPRVEIVIGGDGSLAEASLDGWAEDRPALERLGVAPRRRIVFRRRLDALASDLELVRSGERPAAWSPDLEHMASADVVVIDLLAEMHASPDLRLPRGGEAPAGASHLVAVRWLPVDGTAPPPLVIDPARRLSPADVAAELDRLAGLIDGTLVVITHGEANVAPFPWRDWIAEVNATLRRRAPAAAWRLADAGAAMDALEPGHLRAPWVALPDAHAAVLRATVTATVEDAVRERRLATPDRPRSAPVRGFGGRRRAAHSCVTAIDEGQLDLWARTYRRVAIAGAEFSAPGLVDALASRGVTAARVPDPASIDPAGQWDAAILLTGRFTHEAMAAWSRDLGGIPVESPLTQGPAPEAARLWRSAVRELWRRLYAAGGPVGIVGDGPLARIMRRAVADLPAPPVAWRIADVAPDPGDSAAPDAAFSPSAAVRTVVLAVDRDKLLQARVRRWIDAGTELVVPAAWGGGLTAPASPVFCPDSAASFLADGQPHDVEGQWVA